MPSTSDKLTRSHSNRKISGVCGGIAHHFGWDPTLVRLAYALFAFFTGVVPGIILYAVFAYIMPE